jgi:hypothetical protein
MVHAAQGVIDNGGLQDFFGSDFPGRPSYERFVEAYRAIGADEAASDLEQALALFPFPDSHLHVGRRQAWLDALRSCGGDAASSNAFDALSDRLCGNEDVWRKLESYIERHPASFGLKDAR